MSVYEGHGVTLHHGDCLDVLRTLPDASVDSVVTDPPYGLEFMGKDWDAPWKAEGAHWREASRLPGSHSTNPTPRPQNFGTAGKPFQDWCEQWARECLRVLKPGGHMLAFGGTRTWHRLACAVEDAGFEVRDSIAWMYGSGFPKSLRVSRDERFCHCDASVHTSSRTSPERSPDDHTRTERDEAAAEGGGRSAPRATSAPLGSPAGYRPEPGSGDALPRRAGVTDLASAQPREGARARSHSAELAGDPVAGSLRSPFLARRTAHPSSLDSASPSRSLTGEPTHTQASTSPAGTSESASDTRGTAQDPSYLYGTGFPLCSTCDKPMVDGLGTAMKPSFEPVVVARKPLAGTVAGNVLAWGTGALNVDGCRIAVNPDDPVNTAVWTSRPSTIRPGTQGFITSHADGERSAPRPPGLGRWPANVVLDPECATLLDEQSGTLTSGANPTRRGADGDRQAYGEFGGQDDANPQRGADSGGASRFFFVASHDKGDTSALTGKGGRIESCETASTAAESSSPPRQFGDSALGGAVTSEHPDTASQTGSPSTSATPSGSRPSGRPATPTTQNIDAESSPEQQPGERTPTASPASSVGPSAPTVTTTTTTSPSTSAGSAAPATSDTTSQWKALGDTDSAPFKYVAKADATERPRVNGTAHPTVKPRSLMRWLVRLVTPPGGTVLEPFAGSGTTVEACIVEGFDCIAIEKGDEYLPLIMQRIHRRRDPVAAIRQTGDELGLFELDGEGA